MKKVAILQSNYIPWKGYFDLINMVDEFILYDDVQYTTNDWRNRNKIKTLQGTQWLSIPVLHKGRVHQKIKETEIITSKWAEKHWRALQCNYSKAPYFEEYYSHIQELYRRGKEEKYLSQVNYIFIKSICDILGVKTKISWSSEYILESGKTERLVSICKQAQAKEYISGPAASNYIVEKLFELDNITLTYMDYSNYPEYPQMYGQFVHEVTILDMLFHLGNQTQEYMKSFSFE